MDAEKEKGKEKRKGDFCHDESLPLLLLLSLSFFVVDSAFVRIYT
jgi:hypothetical protein